MDESGREGAQGWPLFFRRSRAGTVLTGFMFHNGEQLTEIFAHCSLKKNRKWPFSVDARSRQGLMAIAFRRFSLG